MLWYFRQYYTYVTDFRCTRVGTQCWVFGVITLTESLICIKFGLEIFAHTQIFNIIIWLVIQASLSALLIGLWVIWNKKQSKVRFTTFKKKLGLDIFALY